MFPLWHGKVATANANASPPVKSGFRFGMVKLQRHRGADR